MRLTMYFSALYKAVKPTKSDYFGSLNAQSLGNPPAGKYFSKAPLKLA